jgi:hypothetical protein
MVSYPMGFGAPDVETVSKIIDIEIGPSRKLGR